MNGATFLRSLPVVSVSVIYLFMGFALIQAAANIGAIVFAHINGNLPSWNIGNPLTPSLLWVVVVSCLSVFGWLLSTRVKFYQKRWTRVCSFFTMLFAIMGVYVWFFLSDVFTEVIPFFTSLSSEVSIDQEFVQTILLENYESFGSMLLWLPLALMGLITLYFNGLYLKYKSSINEAFFEFEWKGKWLQKFSQIEKASEVVPDVELGPDRDTKELVKQPGKDRTLNSAIIGTIGTGKTAALGLPILNQDLHHMTRYINDYPRISEKEDFHSEDVKGNYLSGISIVEPSNDLCKSFLSLAKAHDIPDEAITYINPLDKNTPNINPMKGPADKVAEAFTQVIEGLNESGGGGNFFFEQSERIHLKNYIYLLKLHDPDQEVTFDYLLNMYDDPQYVHRMHRKLKANMRKALYGSEEKGKNSDLLEHIRAIEDQDERNHWLIVKQIDEWFNATLLPVEDRDNYVKVRSGPYKGDYKYYDAEAGYVKGLRNILNDIGANPLIRRVLFGKSDFDFDEHMESGGVLLVNTAKGELAQLSSVLGKFVLLSLQNATFRRKPKVSSYHHILVDEAPDYMYQPFREFPAQSRKYKVILTVIMQTLSQLADRYGEHYLNSLVAGLRHRMVYGDVPSFDARYFSEMFGDQDNYKESTTEQSVSPLQEDPMTRAGSNYSLEKETTYSTGDIIFQREFECIVKIVVNNRPVLHRIKANFVPKEEFTQATIVVQAEAGKHWLNHREIQAKDQVQPSIFAAPSEAAATTQKEVEEVQNQENPTAPVPEEEKAEQSAENQEEPWRVAHEVEYPQDEINIPIASVSRLSRTVPSEPRPTSGQDRSEPTEVEPSVIPGAAAQAEEEEDTVIAQQVSEDPGEKNRVDKSEKEEVVTEEQSDVVASVVSPPPTENEASASQETSNGFELEKENIAEYKTSELDEGDKDFFSGLATVTDEETKK